MANKLYNTFEDLEVYKIAREFRKRIYKLVKELPKDEKYNITIQMRRAAVSLTNNIAEGHGGYHYRESIQFLRQARGSLEELIDDLNVCIDENYVDRDYIEKLKQEAYTIIKKVNSYIKYLKNQNLVSINQ
jgi:four helix bundle protein